MKLSSGKWILLSFLPSVLVLAVITRGFQTTLLTVGDLIFPTILLIVCLIFVWNRSVYMPEHDFLNALNRAINGDYRARFSCSDSNDDFKKLSFAFNQLMSCVENQTDELTENRHLQNQLYENEKIYRSALELTCERVFEADLTHNRLVYGQTAYYRTFPFLKTEMFDEMVHLIAQNAVLPEDAEKYEQTFLRRSILDVFRKSGTSEITLEYRQIRPGADPFWVAATVILLNNTAGDDLKIIGYVKNIDERKKHEIEIFKQSQKDGLTGLYNKKVTQSMIENYLADAGKNGNHAVIMVDIDNFKRINDTLGHIQGDVALMKIAQKIQGLFRSTDIAGRVGGDEFLILMKNFGSLDILFDKLKSIGTYFNDIRLEDESYRISGSIGVSLYPEDGTTYDVLYKKSDMALYYSKAHGKDQFYFYGGRFGEKYGIFDTSAIAVLDEKEYVPREKPIDSPSTMNK